MLVYLKLVTALVCAGVITTESCFAWPDLPKVNLPKVNPPPLPLPKLPKMPPELQFQCGGKMDGHVVTLNGITYVCGG